MHVPMLMSRHVICVHVALHISVHTSVTALCWLRDLITTPEGVSQLVMRSFWCAHVCACTRAHVRMYSRAPHACVLVGQHARPTNSRPPARPPTLAAVHGCVLCGLSGKYNDQEDAEDNSDDDDRNDTYACGHANTQVYRHVHGHVWPV